MSCPNPLGWCFLVRMVCPSPSCCRCFSSQPSATLPQGVWELNYNPSLPILGYSISKQHSFCSSSPHPRLPTPYCFPEIIFLCDSFYFCHANPIPQQITVSMNLYLSFCFQGTCLRNWYNLMLKGKNEYFKIKYIFPLILDFSSNSRY